MKDTGGPAFPHSRLGSDADGMTLRDYFAAKAMQSLILRAQTSKDVDLIAKNAYRWADALIKERNHGQA